MITTRALALTALSLALATAHAAAQQPTPPPTTEDPATTATPPTAPTMQDPPPPPTTQDPARPAPTPQTAPPARPDPARPMQTGERGIREHGMQPVPAYDRLDVRGDGQVGRDDLAGHPALQEKFGDIDTAGDGTISRAEYDAWMARKRAHDARPPQP